MTENEYNTLKELLNSYEDCDQKLKVLQDLMAYISLHASKGEIPWLSWHVPYCSPDRTDIPKAISQEMLAWLMSRLIQEEAAIKKMQQEIRSPVVLPALLPCKYPDSATGDPCDVCDNCQANERADEP